MENSIEQIWKKGFINEDVLIAPKLNQLFDQKSAHVIDKYKRVFRKNIFAIVLGSILLIPLSWLAGIPYMGIMMFFMLNAMAIVDGILLNKLENIDKHENCYLYLQSFKKWFDLKNKANIRMARILYPYVFLSMLVGVWLMDIKETYLGSWIMDRLLEIFPDTWLVFGLPFWGIIGSLAIICTLAWAAKRLYLSDIKLVYGGVLAKLDELISDMEELRK